MTTVQHTTLPAPGQYLGFHLGTETYAVGILTVREIIEYPGLTEVPMVPAAVRGVINLRGAVVPVVDPMVRFGKPPSPIGRRTCVVIVEVADAAGRPRTFGMVVDGVSEVVDIAAADLEAPPSFGARVRVELMQGMARVRGRLLIVLDVQRLLDLDDFDPSSMDTASLPEPLAA